MDPRLVELSRTMDAAELGRRLRNARLGAGLTQGDVAGDDVTSAYLSRIEAGKRRPEYGLLEKMAARVGVPLEELLGSDFDASTMELRVALDHAELSLLAGNAAAALAEVEALLERLTQRRVPDLDLAARYLHARTLEAVGDYNAAILLLEDLVSTPRSDSDWLRAAIALTRCYRQIGDTARAIEVGENAGLKAVDLGLEGATEAIQLTVTVASAYTNAGDNDHALRLCLRALQTAERHGSSPIASASAYWNASIIEARRGQVASASDYAQRAIAIFEVAHDNRALASLRTAAAELHLESDPPDPDAALEQLAQAELEMGWAANGDADKADLLVIRARAYLQLGEVDAAQASLDRAALVVPSAAVFVRATAASVAGQVAAARGQMDEARERYLEGVRTLTGAAADRRVSELWREFAELLAESGDDKAALDAYRAATAASGAHAARKRVANR